MRVSLREMTEKQVIELDLKLVSESWQKARREIFLLNFFIILFSTLSIIGIPFIPIVVWQLVYKHGRHMKQLPVLDQMGSVYNYTKNCLRYIAYYAFKREYGKNYFPFEELRSQIGSN